MITIYKKTAEELHKHSLFSISNSTVFNSYKLSGVPPDPYFICI